MLTCGSVFSGIGLLDYGLHLAGIKHAWFCEADEWRRGILAKRWPGARVHADVRHVGHGCEPVTLIAGGFPCKGASTAGKRNGFDHPETVLWREMARAVGELRPRYVLVENVAHILALHDGAVWGEVLGDLATLGYDIVWDCLPAGAVGAPHLRDRVLAVAVHAEGIGEARPRGDDRGRNGSRGIAAIADSRATPDTNGARRPAGWKPERPGGERHGHVADEDAACAAPDALRPGLEGRGLPGPVANRAGAAPDSAGSGGPAGRGGEFSRGGEHGTRGRNGAFASAAALADPSRDGIREQPEPERWRSGPAIAPGAGATPADAARDAEGRPGATAGADRERTRIRAGVAVEWGDYEPAIRRWEAIHGPAPEPLVRRMDDRSAARMERARLSALGDGVQVQVGRIAGEYIVSLERARLA